MIVWLVTVGEPLPTDAGAPRLLRAGILADLLADKGHVVHWWSSSFDHQQKKQRARGYRRLTYRPNATLHLLPGRSYASNVSFARVGNHRDNAEAFTLHAGQCSERPDVILCSYPTAELCEAAIAYGAARSIAVVVDVRDLWPDIFEELLPQFARPLARPLLLPMRRQSRRVFERATAITGVTAEFVAWGLQRGHRPPSANDWAFAMAYVERPPAPAALAEARARWHEMGVVETHLNFVFFGTIGRQFDLSTVIAAAREVSDSRVRFIICGTGDRLDQYRALAAHCDNIVFPGWIDSAMIRSLMSMSVAGLAPYNLSDNFNSNIPNKIIEYLAGGLPIVTTLGGVPGAMLVTRGCGLTYPHGSIGDLRTAIESLATDAVRQQAMAASALALYRERFDAGHVYGEMIDYLGRIAGQHSGSAAVSQSATVIAA
jgi:glycosyltransferase involved in cell wall biosynthesis